MMKMKMVWMMGVAAAAAIAGFGSAQAQTSGISKPPAAVITASQDEAPVAAPITRSKPSAAVSAIGTASSTPATNRRVISSQAASSTVQTVAPMNQTSGSDPDAEIVTSVGGPTPPPDDSGIVTSVASRANEVPAGTILKTKIRETLSTASTVTGTKFTAEVTEPMERNGRVVIPVGSVVRGRVTEVRGGRRVRGAAALHLVPESVTLPDGTYYPLHAQVFDTSQYQATKVDSEGTILRKDHVGATLAAMSLTTGGAAATGAVIGGGVGALVGAGVGAGVSTVWWLKQDRQEVIPANSGITFGLVAPLTITPISMGTR